MSPIHSPRLILVEDLNTVIEWSMYSVLIIVKTTTTSSKLCSTVITRSYIPQCGVLHQIRVSRAAIEEHVKSFAIVAY